MSALNELEWRHKLRSTSKDRGQNTLMTAYSETRESQRMTKELWAGDGKSPCRTNTWTYMLMQVMPTVIKSVISTYLSRHSIIERPTGQCWLHCEAVPGDVSDNEGRQEEAGLWHWPKATETEWLQSDNNSKTIRNQLLWRCQLNKQR